MDARYSSRYCVTVFPVIFRKRRQQTSRDRCTCSPSFSSEITDSYHYSDAFLTIEAPFYFLLGLLAVYRTSIQSMQNGRAPFAACMIELVMRLAATVWLSRFLGYTAVCIASPLAWFGAIADSSLLSDDDEACKNSVIKIGPPDIDMPGNAKPGILSLLF